MIINEFESEINDDILNAISRAKFFKNLREIDLKNCLNVKQN